MKYLKSFFVLNLFIFIVALTNAIFVIPTKVSSGGFISIALIIYHTIDIKEYRAGIGVGFITLILNIPLLFYSLFFFEMSYFYKSFYSTLALPIYIMLIDKVLEALAITLPELNLYTNVIIASMLSGIAKAFVLNLGSSTGGTDIVAKIINQFFKFITIGNGIIISNLVIIISSIAVFGFEKAALSAFSIILNGFAVDLTLNLIKKKSYFILQD